MSGTSGTSSHHRYDEKRRIFYVSKHVDNLNMEKKVEWIMHECLDRLLGNLTIKKISIKQGTKLNDYVKEMTQNQPFLSAQAERAIIMLIADTMALYYVNADNDLFNNEITNQRNGEAVEQRWTKQKMIESLAQKVRAKIKQVNEEKEFPGQWNFTLDLDLILTHCDPNIKMDDEKGPQDNKNGC